MSISWYFIMTNILITRETNTLMEGKGERGGEGEGEREGEVGKVTYANNIDLLLLNLLLP